MGNHGNPASFHPTGPEFEQRRLRNDDWLRPWRRRKVKKFFCIHDIYGRCEATLGEEHRFSCQSPVGCGAPSAETIGSVIQHRRKIDCRSCNPVALKKRSNYAPLQNWLGDLLERLLTICFLTRESVASWSWRVRTNCRKSFRA